MESVTRVVVHWGSLSLSLLCTSQLEAKGQAVLDTLDLCRLSPTAPPSSGPSVATGGAVDAWRPSGQGDSPFSASGSDSDVDVVSVRADVIQSASDVESDVSTGGVAEGDGAKRRAHFLDDDDDDSGLNYKDRLAVVKGKQVNESDSEFVPSGEGEVEVEVEGEEEEEEEEDDNVSVQSFSSGGSSEFEAGAAGQRKKAVAGKKQRRAVDDDVSCSVGNTTLVDSDMNLITKFACFYIGVRLWLRLVWPARPNISLGGQTLGLAGQTRLRLSLYYEFGAFTHVVCLLGRT